MLYTVLIQYATTSLISFYKDHTTQPPLSNHLPTPPLTPPPTELAPNPRPPPRLGLPPPHSRLHPLHPRPALTRPLPPLPLPHPVPNPLHHPTLLPPPHRPLPLAIAIPTSPSTHAMARLRPPRRSHVRRLFRINGAEPRGLRSRADAHARRWGRIAG